METICIYHSRDLDGWCSAAIVKKWHDEHPDDYISRNPFKLIGWDYGMEYPNIIMKAEKEGNTPNGEIILVDVSFQPTTMICLRDQLREQFIWIDHHKSAIQDSVTHNYQGMAGTRDQEYAACELTWKYFFPDEPIPRPVELLGMYDSFRHKKENKKIQDTVMYFQYAARAFINNPEECYNQIINNPSFSTMLWLSWGESIFKYLKTEAKQVYNKAFPVEFEDYQFLAVNRERFNPANFEIDYHNDGYDGFACFWFDGLIWTFSLYNDNGEVDVSEICKKYGGGGHKGAAGFTLKDISNFIETQPY